MPECCLTKSGKTKEKRKELSLSDKVNVMKEFEKFGKSQRCGESRTVEPVTVNESKNKLPQLIEGYAPRDIYNMDETGLTYCVLADKTAGGKQSKERLTVSLCVIIRRPFTEGSHEN